MKRLINLVLVAVAALLTIGPPARSQVVSLDAVYAGTAGWHDLFFPRAVFGATGENLVASSGLTRADMSSEGFVDFNGGYHQNDGLGSLRLSAPNGDRISVLISGEGTIHHYAGVFSVTSLGGKGRFAGATGSGAFLLEAGTYTSGSSGFTAPATLTIHGSVTAPAIPEPGTLALLYGPLLLAVGAWASKARPLFRTSV